MCLFNVMPRKAVLHFLKMNILRPDFQATLIDSGRNDSLLQRVDHVFQRICGKFP